jgi:glycosyltransferase involved in cell wall biosynthesis
VVLHTHFIPNQQVAAYFAACDLVAQTYKNATQSGVTQIAYHFEKPMLVTDVGGLAELVPDGKVGYVCAAEEEAIRSSLEDFFLKKDPEAFRAGLHEQKQLFSWARLHEQIQEVSGIR